MFAYAVGMEKGNVTASAVTHALGTFSHVTLGGLTPSLSYTNGARTVPCGYHFDISNHKFALLNGGKLACD